MQKNELLFDIYGQVPTSSPFLWLLFSAVPPGEPVCSSMTVLVARKMMKTNMMKHYAFQ